MEEGGKRIERKDQRSGGQERTITGNEVDGNIEDKRRF